jgi:hypothetical protein
MIEWGGEVVNSDPEGQHTSTQMGSGHFPGEGFGRASYFKNIQIVDGSNNLRPPKDIGTFTEQPNCYDVQNRKSGDNWGNYFYYGGPGRNPNCPWSFRCLKIKRREGKRRRGESFSCSLHVTPNVPTTHMPFSPLFKLSLGY